MDINGYKRYISEETMMGPNSVRILAELFERYPLQLTADDQILDLKVVTYSDTKCTPHRPFV